MGDTTPQRPRPASVTMATVMLSLSVLIAMIKTALGAQFENPFGYVVIALAGGIQGFVIWLIFSGRNWARCLFLILFVVGLLMLPAGIEALLMRSSFYVATYGIQLVLQLVAAVALCLRPARQWYGIDAKGEAAD